MRLRYAGTCVACGHVLEKGTEAYYDAASRTVHCIECPPAVLGVSSLDRGNAGASAHERYERLKANRASRIRDQYGDRFGGFLLWLSPESQTTRAWAAGAVGERRLAAAMAELLGVETLHDRRVPRTRGNIDHLLVGPGGVFVVDAKNYRGNIHFRDVGGFFKTDYRLYVGRRDCSKLADQMAWQVEAVKAALAAAGLATLPVTPVLCFIDGDWPLINPPSSFRGVRLEGLKSIRRLVASPGTMNSDRVAAAARALSIAFPPKA